MATKTPEVIAAGHICLDLIPSLQGSYSSLDKLFIPGRLIQTGRAITATGGAVSNTGLALHRLGMNTGLMGKIGDDLIGRAILDVLRSYDEHLAAGMVVSQREDSSYTVVISPPGLDRIFLHCQGANNTFAADDIDYDKLDGVRLLHFGYPPLMQRFYEKDGEQLALLFRNVKEKGLTTSLDMAMPDPQSEAGQANWPAILQSTLPYVDVFLPSIEEILYMIRRDTFDELNARAEEASILPLVTPAVLADVSSTLLQWGAKIVCLKLGDQGLYLRTADSSRFDGAEAGGPADAAAWGGRELWAPCFQARHVVGTTGSGDCTIAGFLAGLLKGLAPAETLTGAVAVGASNVEAADAVSGIAPWERVQQRIADGWERLPIRCDITGWRYDPARKLWVGPHDAGFIEP